MSRLADLIVAAADIETAYFAYGEEECTIITNPEEVADAIRAAFAADPTLLLPPGHDGVQVPPPWADGTIPDVNRYVESELFVAGAISTMPPFDKFHPAWALPIARQALDALGQWEPTDA